jgi:error-prone DNA polymerase
VVLSAGLLACRGRVQREGEVIHLIAEHLIDLTDLLRSVGERNGPFSVPHGRGDEAEHGRGPDQRGADGLGRKPRDKRSDPAAPFAFRPRARRMLVADRDRRTGP